MPRIQPQGPEVARRIRAAKMFEILPQLLLNSLIAGSIYALISSGFSLNYGLFRILNFAHGHFMMVGAYIFYLFIAELGFGLSLASLFTLGIAFLFSWCTLNVFVTPFLRYHFLLVLITTIAFGHMAEAIISMGFGVNVKSLSAGSLGESIVIGSVYVTPIQIIIIVSAMLLLFALAATIHCSSLGRKIRALSINSHAAESLGINRSRVTSYAYLVSVILAFYAGIVVAYETNIQPTMGMAYTLKAFASMVLGGFGNIWGTVAGAYLLGFVENLSIGLDFGGYSIPASYKDAFAFMIMLLILLIKPEGLFQRKKRSV